MESVALVSYGAICLDDITPGGLRLLSLLFDRIHFNALAPRQDDIVPYILDLYDPETDIPPNIRHKMTDIWMGVGDAEAEFNLNNIKKNWPWEHAPEKLRNAAKEVMEISKEENETPQGAYESYKLAGYLMHDIQFWQKHFPGSTFVGESIGNQILRRTASSPEIINEVSSLETGIPDLSALSWADVLELRDSPFLKEYRFEYWKAAREGNSDGMLSRYQESLEKIADEVRPRPLMAAVKSVLTNIPFLAVNPISIVTGVHDIHKEAARKKNFGWAYFFKDMRNRVIEKD